MATLNFPLDKLGNHLLDVVAHADNRAHGKLDVIEASPGPRDSAYLFDRFRSQIVEGAA